MRVNVRTTTATATATTTTTTTILVRTHTQQYARSEQHTQLANMRFDIFDLTPVRVLHS